MDPGPVSPRPLALFWSPLLLFGFHYRKKEKGEKRRENGWEGRERERGQNQLLNSFMLLHISINTPAYPHVHTCPQATHASARSCKVHIHEDAHIHTHMHMCSHAHRVHSVHSPESVFRGPLMLRVKRMPCVRACVCGGSEGSALPLYPQLPFCSDAC